jgi:hypothetical protein
MKIKRDLTMKAKPIKILDGDEKLLRNKRVPLVRVLWRSSQIEEEIWERESEMKEKFSHISLTQVCNLNFEDEIFIRRGECKSREKIKAGLN